MMESMNDSVGGINRQEMFEEVRGVIDFLQQCYREQQPVHGVESGLWGRMLQLGRRLLGAFFGLYGDGDAGEVLVLGDGREVRRLKEPQSRSYQNPFGAFELTRMVYGSREGQKIAAIPFDGSLWASANRPSGSSPGTTKYRIPSMLTIAILTGNDGS